MRCGTTLFTAELIINGEKTIIAHTPAEARKSIRKTYGKDTVILSVRKKRNNA